MRNMNLSDFRRIFPITETDIYLNHAAVSPLSTRVKSAISDSLTRRMSGPVEIFPEFSEEKKRLKENIGRLVNADSSQIAIVSNTSEGLNCLASGLTWKKGDRVLLVENEFPANIYPFLNLKRLGVLIDFVPTREGHIFIEDIEKEISDRTRLFSISFVEFLNGFRNQLGEIGALCKRKNVIFSVDGIQGTGGMPVDVSASGVDFMANGGHKWLMGPMGCGFMYISADLFHQLHPAYVGWLSVKDSWNFFDYRLDLLEDAGRFEIATPNFLGIKGLRISTDILLEAGITAIEQHLLKLGDKLIDGLSAQGFHYIGAAERKNRSGIYSFRTVNEKALFTHLQAQRVHLSLREDIIRFAPHFYNTEAEIDEVLNLCSKFAEK